MAKNKSNNVTAKMYDTLVRPVITEKSMVSSEAGKVVFIVPLSATKDSVKAAVEAIFNVKVNKVNTIKQFGKVKSLTIMAVLWSLAKALRYLRVVDTSSWVSCKMLM